MASLDGGLRSGRVHPVNEVAPFEITSLAIQQRQPLEQRQECRICIEAGGNLIRPCKCCGSAAFVHFECLKIWIEKRSEDKDGVLRQFLRIDCEMCKHQFIFHTHITESFSCDEYARMDTCRAEIVLQLFFIGFFVVGAIACGILLSRGITADQESPPETMKYSLATICYMIAVPTSVIFALAFIRSFVCSYFVRRQCQIVKIDEYQSSESAAVPEPPADPAA